MSDENDPDIEHFARTAFLASEFLGLLRDARVPDTLAHDMVLAWHQWSLEAEVVWYDLTEEEDD